MATKLEEIAAKARYDTNLQFTSLCHHITRDMIWENLKHIPTRSAPGVYEADLKNFFGSLDHGWLLRFVKHRVGDPRIISLIQRWLKAGVLEDNELQISELGTPKAAQLALY